MCGSGPIAPSVYCHIVQVAQFTGTTAVGPYCANGLNCIQKVIRLLDAIAACAKVISAPKKPCLLPIRLVRRVNVRPPLRRFLNDADQSIRLCLGKVHIAVMMRDIDDCVDHGAASLAKAQAQRSTGQKGRIPVGFRLVMIFAPST